MPKPRRSGRPSGRSKYREIAADIAGKIAAGEFPIGKPLPTWSELSRIYSVGEMTVGQAMRVLKQDGYINASPRQRPVARLGLSFNKIFDLSIGIVTHTYINLIIRPERNRWNAAMFQGVTKAVMYNCWPIVVLQGPLWRTDFPAGLAHMPLQGLLLLGCPFRPDLFKQYQELNERYPVVTLDEHSDYLHSIALDNFAIIRDATLRLVALGHRKIAFVRPYHDSPLVRNIDSTSKLRADAFVATCQEAGLAPDEYKIFSTTVSAFASHSFRAIIRTVPRFTAVLAPDNCQHVAAEAELAGLHIPRDLSIVGFSQSLPSRWSGPAVNFEEFGAKGVELIRSKPTTLQRILIPTSWNDGETAGPAPG